MEEMVYLGYQYGSFKDERSGRSVNYAHIFTMEPFEDSGANPDYHTDGYKAGKHKLASRGVLKGLDLEPLDVVEVYFNSKGAVTKIVPKESVSAEDWMEREAEA